MPDPSHELKLSPNLGRRRFNQLVALATGGVLTGGFSFPAIAHADASVCPEFNTTQEKYHLFIDQQLARSGGRQVLTLRSGATRGVSIPRYGANCAPITLRGAAVDGGDAVVILHSLYDPFKLIDQAMASTLLLAATYDRCQEVYQQVKRGEGVSDLQALDVLDTLVAGSSTLKKAENGENLQKRYQLASQNSRLVELQTYIEQALDKSDFSAERKQKLRGIYQYIQANDPLPGVEDYEALTAIDAIVQGSTLPVPLRQRYAVASAQTRAFTVDKIIQDLIRAKYPTDKEGNNPYLKTYNQVRLGILVEDRRILEAIDLLVSQSNLPPEGKAIYNLARDRFFQQNKQQVQTSLETYLDASQQAAETAAEIVPKMTTIFAAGGVTAGTGTAISSLTGAAATNATLAALGGGSVAAGGLGMLGGLAVATGGAALVGAAALVSVAVVADMSPAELGKLGVAATAGLLTSAAVMGTAWAIVTTFMIAESLKGAAAISVAIATMGGLSTITGGAALIAFGVALGVWKFLQNDDADLIDTLKQLESALYITADVESLDPSLFPRVRTYLGGYQQVDRTYVAPNLPLDKVANLLASYTSIDRDEKILAIRDLSNWLARQDGVAFTDRGVWWKYSSSSSFIEYSDPEYFLKVKELPIIKDDKESRKVYELALMLGKDSIESRMGVL